MLAYLISAFRDPAHLAHLIASLDYEADFYVHIDANVDDEPFRQALPAKVKFVPGHRISWGGYEQVSYQYELLKAASESGKDYGHLICLSGLDYPLWSNRRIHKFLADNPSRQFMEGYNLTHTDNAKQLEKITHIHPFRDLHCPLWLKNKLVVASRHLLSWLGIRRSPRVPLGGREADVYFGSDYWAITLPCARYIVHALESEPDFTRYFRTVYIPSELCLQTLVYNSPFGREAMLYEGPFPGLTALTPLHHIHYQGAIKVFTLADLETLQKSGKMFCRKVITGKSDELVKAIDRLRAEEDSPTE